MSKNFKKARKETDQATLDEIALKAPDGVTRAIAASKLTDQSVLVVNRVSVTAEQPKPRFKFDCGESVKINDGPFKDFTGVVEEVYPERDALKVIITILGRTTPVYLETEQVEKI